MGEPGAPQIDRYTLEGELGRGGFGAVYLARHAVLGTEVALKVLHADQAQSAEAVGRFLQEARAAASIGNPHIIHVSDAGVTGDQQAFLAMERLRGEDLAGYLERCGRLGPREAVHIARQILDGLAAAHAAGIVHRDMKPANVFLVPRGSGEVFVKLLDFGVSKIHGPVALGGGLTATGTILGTPTYMAPEQLMETKSVDARADLYSVGVMLYEMMGGRLPYDAETLGALIREVLEQTPPPLHQLAGDVSPALTEVVQRALAKDPARRWESAERMSTALDMATEETQRDGGIPSTVAGPVRLSTPIHVSATTRPLGTITAPPGTSPALAPTAMASPPPSAPAPTGSTSRRSPLPWVGLGAVLLVCPLLLCGGALATDRVQAALAVLVGAEPTDAGAGGSGGSGGGGLFGGGPSEVPIHHGAEEQVGQAGLSVERSARRRGEDGGWIVETPITFRNLGETGGVVQASEFAADGFVQTAAGDWPTFMMLAPGRHHSGYLAWRQETPGEPPEYLTLRFRGWARRVPVSEGDRLPPRPPPSE